MRTTKAALYAALEFYSDHTHAPWEVAFKYTHPNGFQELISFSDCAELALAILQREDQVGLICFQDPILKHRLQYLQVPGW